MSESTYLLVLRQDADYSGTASREALRERLRRIPGLSALGDDRFQFGETDEDGVMELQLQTRSSGRPLSGGDADRHDAVEVRVPRPWVMRKGPQVFALIFMMAEWNGWTVFDPQIDDVLHKEAVLQGLVAVRQAQLEREGRGAGGTVETPFSPGPQTGPPPAEPEPYDLRRGPGGSKGSS